MAASVSTRVVSWKEAAEMNESVDSEALVIPSSRGRPVAGCPDSPRTRSFSDWKRNLSTCSSTMNSVSPTSSTFTQRIIWRTIVSMCLRSEEHTSELQSPCNLVCRLLLEKKKQILLLYKTTHICHS